MSDPLEVISVKLLDAKAGDMLVVQLHGLVNDEVHHRIYEDVQSRIAKGVAVMVIDDSVSLKILRKV